MQALYTAQANVTGGRVGHAQSDDGLLNVDLSTPKALGGPGGNGTNPEQLFAAGYASCFLSALKLVAGKQKIAVPDTAAVHAEVGIGPNGQGGFALSASLTVSLPGVDAAVAQQLIDTAHQVCPYSNATRGNIPVQIKLA
ncbi:organic hydroperoxide resistance protein [Massilia sp. W12]|uniref:organic hydroperoxide resistance protein n=1 Tax=Massilia sp. W12 TaxID=3126507 RepID=UPI0030D55DEB